MSAVLVVVGLVVGAGSGWLAAPLASWALGPGELRWGRPWRLVPALVGAACAGALSAAWAPTTPAVVPAAWVFVVSWMALCVADLRVGRLPNALVAGGLALTGGCLVVGAAVSGDWSSLGRAVAGASVCVVFHLGLRVLSGWRMGLGDVKAASLTGLLLAWAGWQVLVVGVLGSFFVGAAAVGAMSAAGRGRRRVPFGPAMFTAAVLGLLFGNTFVSWYLGLVGL